MQLQATGPLSTQLVFGTCARDIYHTHIIHLSWVCVKTTLCVVSLCVVCVCCCCCCIYINRSLIIVIIGCDEIAVNIYGQVRIQTVKGRRGKGNPTSGESVAATSRRSVISWCAR